MASTNQTGDQQRRKFQALSKGLSQIAEALARQGEDESRPEADSRLNSPDTLDELLARATDPSIADALVDG